MSYFMRYISTDATPITLAQLEQVLQAVNPTYRVVDSVLHLGDEVYGDIEINRSGDELFEDEIDLHRLPGISGCWTKRGTQRNVATPGQNQKRYGFGAVNMLTGALTRLMRERKNSDSFCALLDQIVQQYCTGDTWVGPKVVLVVDNYIIHRSKRTQRTVNQYADRLVMCGLPTYAPQLNVIELLWKHLRRRVTHNDLFESVAALVAAVEQFFGEIDHQPTTVLSVIGCDMLPEMRSTRWGRIASTRG